MYSKYVKLRNDKGITDYRVAIDTGIRRSTFSDWKSGRSKPKTDKLKIREFDTLKCKKVPQSLEIGLFFCQIFIFII